MPFLEQAHARACQSMIMTRMQCVYLSRTLQLSCPYASTRSVKDALNGYEDARTDLCLGYWRVFKLCPGTAARKGCNDHRWVAIGIIWTSQFTWSQSSVAAELHDLARRSFWNDETLRKSREQRWPAWQPCRRWEKRTFSDFIISEPSYTWQLTFPYHAAGWSYCRLILLWQVCYPPSQILVAIQRASVCVREQLGLQKACSKGSCVAATAILVRILLVQGCQGLQRTFCHAAQRMITPYVNVFNKKVCG